MDPSGKVALVTGAAGGLGSAFCKALLAAGAKVVLTDIDDVNGKKQTAELEKQFGKGSAIFVKSDVTNSSSLEEAFKAAKSTFRRLDIVINSAGIIRETMWEKLIDINIKGTMHSMLLSFKYMGKNAGGSGGLIVNLSSISGLNAQNTLPLYSCSKHAVNVLARGYGDPIHVEQNGVSVIAICPGASDTPFTFEASQYLLHDYIREPLNKLVADIHINMPEFIAEGLMHAIREGRSGSVWLIDNGKVEQVDYPPHLR